SFCSKPPAASTTPLRARIANGLPSRSVIAAEHDPVAQARREGEHHRHAKAQLMGAPPLQMKRPISFSRPPLSRAGPG
ncbi:hypothetical protein, partial [Nocardia cyriacigeorgica]|uniref:hypothetical protein n=1 Tax=Nocardia cyriacigeorgica TaxID=135487 RepID=UPI002455756C